MIGEVTGVKPRFVAIPEMAVLTNQVSICPESRALVHICSTLATVRFLKCGLLQGEEAVNSIAVAAERCSEVVDCSHVSVSLGSRPMTAKYW